MFELSDERPSTGELANFRLPRVPHALLVLGVEIVVGIAAFLDEVFFDNQRLKIAGTIADSLAEVARLRNRAEDNAARTATLRRNMNGPYIVRGDFLLKLQPIIARGNSRVTPPPNVVIVFPEEHGASKRETRGKLQV